MPVPAVNGDGVPESRRTCLIWSKTPVAENFSLELVQWIHRPGVQLVSDSGRFPGNAVDPLMLGP